MGRSCIAGEFLAALGGEARQPQQPAWDAIARGDLGQEPRDEIARADRVDPKEVGPERDIVGLEQCGKPCRVGRSADVLQQGTVVDCRPVSGREPGRVRHA